MDHTRLHQLRANRVIAYNIQLNAEKGRVFKTVNSAQYLNQSNGGMRIITGYKVYVEDTMATTTSMENPCITLITQIFTALQDLLVYNASISVPPTRSARIAYLWFFTVASAYSWVSSRTSITGTKDSWNWNTKYLLSDDTNIFVWMTQILINTMPIFIPSYDTNKLLEQSRANFFWTAQQHQTVIDQVKLDANFTLWLSTWQTWYTGRQADGNVAAGTAATDAQLRNGATVLDVTTSQDFTNATAYPKPRKWTPLRVGGAKKNFLTYGWGDVDSTCLTAGDETAIKSAATTHFLDPEDSNSATATANIAARDSEIDDVVTLSNSLTDTQKAIAEFWAGGPLTVSPPCMMIWFWKKYIELTNPELHVMIYSGLELAINIFEGSRLTWDLKRAKMEARPIQEIRRRYVGQNLKKYDASAINGTTINGNIWVPYQETNFVTPPFPDFPSGHSTFSQGFANVMNAWFSSSIPTTSINASDLNLLSPMYTGLGTLRISLSNIPVKARTSLIQTGLVPTSDVHLAWSVWQDIADSAGVSRQYGGIHAASADLGGKAVANTAFPLITSRWAISRT
jgi:membrane-associated phospholipid phosphatase